jgi:lysophospholipase L1-like esterase
VVRAGDVTLAVVIVAAIGVATFAVVHDPKPPVEQSSAVAADGSGVGPAASAAASPTTVPTAAGSPSAPSTSAAADTGDQSAAVIGDGVSAGGASWYARVMRQDPVLRDVHNAAKAGDTTAQMLARFSADGLAGSPKVLVVQAGGSDLRAGVTQLTVVLNVRQMVSIARAHGATVVLCTVPPVAGVSDTAVRALNTALRALAKPEQVPVLDLYAAVAEGGKYRSGLSDDGTVPNAAGAQAIAAAVLPTLQAADL